MKGYLLIGPVITLLIALVFYMRRRSYYDGSTWKTNAAALGLRLEARTMPVVNAVDEVMTGVRGTVPVEVRGAMGDVPRLDARAMLAKPLHAGLVATTREPWLPHHHQLPVVDVPELRGWKVRARDVERARAILGGVVDALLAHRSRGFDVVIDDEWVAVSMSSRGAGDDVRAAVDAAVALQRAIAKARRAVGASAKERDAKRAWREAAEQTGLAFDDAAMKLEGEREAMRFAVALTNDAVGTTGTRVTVTTKHAARGDVNLGRPMPSGFTDLAAELFQQKTVTTGDATFDARFAASGSSAEAAMKVLTDDVRAAMLELPARVWRVSVQGTTMELDGDDVLDASEIAETVRLAAVIARLLGASGAYR